MLSTLSIRNFVLIERLDIDFSDGLCVLTGETGAGKSILLDALSLVIGARADASQVRKGDDKRASITATFELPDDHIILDLLRTHEIDPPIDGDPLILRRTLRADGGSRAYINDQPISVSVLKNVGESLIEIEGQFASHGLLDPANHRGALDSFGAHKELVVETRQSWDVLKAAKAALAKAREEIDRILTEADYLRHVHAELEELDPQDGEEASLIESRSLMINAEKIGEIINQSLNILSGNKGFQQSLSKSTRALERVNEKAAGILKPSLDALERIEDEIAIATDHLNDALRATDRDPTQLEQVDERLFGLRALARKHGTDIDSLASLRNDFAIKLERIDAADQDISRLEAELTEAQSRYDTQASELHDARVSAATALDVAINEELPHLRLETASFSTGIEELEQNGWSSHGIDRVVFEVTTNPGQPAGPISKIASGGELARLLLALKVALSKSNRVTTLVFDEVDAGVGGATAASVADRLSRLSEGVQVLVVTHSPQVAARGKRHFHVIKTITDTAEGEVTTTAVTQLSPEEQREEIARMLAGTQITEEARAAADSLIAEIDKS
ncbi:MAG: DNA repair protein RecN [Alphaproteobacteria bacterium MarineAlpha11_Bin1]|nr:MAG: DNA repair protein RecN [Alphaproteobacteria bacterium MarineAlpha11_Bin1]|tara:strand:+ start:9938 stop:11635 length:1698 start_codon:yes stop_codon:yes gene_type:complete